MAASNVVQSVLAKAQAKFTRLCTTLGAKRGTACRRLTQEGSYRQSELSRTIGLQASQVLKRSCHTHIGLSVL